MYPLAHEFKPNVFQRELLRAAFKHPLTVAETAVRTGKSGAVCFFHRQQCKLNPGVLGLIGVPSFSWYKRVVHEQIYKPMLSKEATWHGQDHIWTFPKYQDAKLAVVSEDNLRAAEGFTAGWFSMEEIQDSTYGMYETLDWRLSDKRARFPHKLLVGVPKFASWASILAATTLNAKLFDAVPTEVNADNIRAGYIEAMKERATEEEFARRALGKRPLPKGRAFPNFNPSLFIPGAPNQGGSLMHYEYNPNLPVYCGVDYGRRAAVTFRQKLPDGRSVIFAELVPNDLTTEALGLAMLNVCVPIERAYPTDNRIKVTKFTSDPDAKQVPELAKVLGTHVHSTYKAVERNIAYGVELINSLLLDANGVRRLLLSHELYTKASKLDQNSRSIVLSLTRMRYPEHTEGKPLPENPIKDGIDDHCADALRYDIVLDKQQTIKAGTFEIR